MAIPSLLRDFLGARGARSIAALICIALIVVSVNIAAARFLDFRLDLTEEGLYTLSPGTLRTLAQIREPITWRFYYSTRLGDEVPSYGVYAQRVRELLDQYVAAAHGRIRLEVYHPQPYSDVEDQAVAFGLQAVPLNDQGDQVYFGLAGTNSTDDTQVIPFFAPDRERLLEYDLTKLVHNLAFPRKTVVGLLTKLPLAGNPMAAMRGQPSQPMAIMRQLEQLYEVRSLPQTIDAVPAGIDVLMLVQPQHLSDKTLYAIDQFVLKGGKALIFVDPYCEMQAAQARAQGRPNPDTASNLKRLFKAWGFKMLPGVVAGDRRDARRVGVPLPNGGVEPMNFIAWLDLHPPELSRSDVITADLDEITMATPGILQPISGAGTRFEPLITTSKASTKIPVAQISGLPDVGALLAHFKSDHRRYVLAARVTGVVRSAFPDGPPAAPQAGKSPADKATNAGAADTVAKHDPHATAEGQPASAPLKRSVKPISLVVVADTDMLADRFWAQSQDFFGRPIVVPVANNGDFVANAIDVLAGGQDLVGLRTRGTSARPFVVVQRIQRAADERYSAEQNELEQKLKATQAKLAGLTGRGPAGATAALSPAEAQTIASFRADMLATRKQLRAVQAALRGNIAELKEILEFCDIALIPILVAAVAIVLGALRLRRRRRTAYG